MVHLMGKAGTFGGTLSLVIGALFIIGWIGAGMVVDYIDNELEENCDSTTGQIGQITGWDDGQCQDGRETRDLVSSLQMPLLGIGTILVVLGGVLFIRS
jgi:hypothetical protein|tara:strand:+ start:120 stop:416 length:297 start_codon:yes stop_codon:yes gene_type:complete